MGHFTTHWTPEIYWLKLKLLYVIGQGWFMITGKSMMQLEFKLSYPDYEVYESQPTSSSIMCAKVHEVGF